MSSASNFNSLLGGQMRTPSNASAYLLKAKKDRLAMLEATRPPDDKVGEQEGVIGATAGAFKLGDSITKVKDKVQKVKSAVGQVQQGIQRGRGVIGGETEEPLVRSTAVSSADGNIGSMGDRVSRIMGSGGGSVRPPDRMNVSNITSGSTNQDLSGITQNITDRANGVLSDARGIVRNTASNIHQAVGGALDSAGADVERAVGTATRVASGAMEATAGVLDALGPIGDILGVGLSIFGGVEAKREKMKANEAVGQAQSEVKQSVKAPVQQATNVSLDTAKQAPMSVSSHY